MFGEGKPDCIRVLFLIEIQFVFKGLKFHQQLRIISFVFDTDENGNDYVTLSHETKQMNWQGGIDSSENLKEKRTYDQTAGDK